MKWYQYVIQYSHIYVKLVKRL